MSAPADFDLTPAHPVRVGTATTDGHWDHQPADVIRVRARDLRDLGRQTASTREIRPHAVVLADIHVAVAADARTARAALPPAAHPGNGLMYVGTPTGLAGLITDIHALGLADGAVLIPVLAGMSELIAVAVRAGMESLDPAAERRTA